MTFANFEAAQETGQPVELFEFKMGTDTYRYTSNDIDITYLSALYEAIPIQRGRLPAGSNRQQEGLTVRMPGNTAFARQFVLTVPGKNAVLTLRKFHRNDPDLETIIIYRGVVRGVAFVDEARVAEAQVMPITSALSRPVPRFTYQGLCNHMLYDARCKISETDPAFEKFLLVTAVSGKTITCSGAGAFGADFFEAGFVGFSADFRLVTGQSGDVLTLLLPFAVSPLGQTVRCLAGCKHRVTTDCQTKFNNVVNFGGFPFVPSKNPFATGLD